MIDRSGRQNFMFYLRRKYLEAKTKQYKVEWKKNS